MRTTGGNRLVLQGKIENLRFRGQESELPVYSWDEFDINRVKPACKVALQDGTTIALSRWKGPKRTRTYPLASVYDTYSFRSGKIITVIPIIKDEGKDTNLDRVNFMTLSWMSLMNVYIILAWYASARRKNETRITDQVLANDYVRTKVEEILHYKMDAHHWNRQHFVSEFIPIYRQAIKSYAEIAREQKVSLHDTKIHDNFIARVRSEGHEDVLDLDRFKALSLSQSQRSARSEGATEHALELRSGSPKTLFEIENNLGGKYYLTADEVEFASEDEVIIRESKNTTQGILPTINDIKDGLFKLLLYSQLSELYHGSRRLRFTTQICLTGQFSGELFLPTDPASLRNFAVQSFGSRRARRALQRLTWLNRELALLGIQGVLRGTQISTSGGAAT